MRAVFFLLLTLPLVAADWTRLRSGEVELLTDAGEKAGRATLARLAQVRATFSETRVPGSEPIGVRIFLFASDREFRQFADSPATDGFFQSGPERDYIVLHTGEGLGRVVGHEYIHRLLNHGTAPLPLWFEEGLAEFYSTLDSRGNRLVVGTPIPAHQETLARQPWLSASQLFSEGKKSPLYDERSRAGLFYAESWALVHMLNLSPQYRTGMPHFAELLASGAPASKAFSEAFARTPDQAVSDLRAYLRHASAVTVDGSPPNPAEIKVEQISELDSTLSTAELALRTGHPEVGRKLFERAAREHPGQSAAEAGLGMLAIFDGNRAEARKHLERAIALGPTAADTWFEYAMFEREEHAPRARVDQLLNKAVALNPNLAEAQFVLGVRLTDDGQYESAIAHLKDALRVLPRQSSFWHALAFALDRVDRSEEALSAARQALRTAVTPEEEAMAQTLVDGLSDPQ